MRSQIIAIIVTALALAFAGCGNNPIGGVSATDSAGPAPEGGAQLWAENCSRCHNLQPPQRYSNAQWDVVVLHMRQRANLTGQDARLITRFLQASN